MDHSLSSLTGRTGISECKNMPNLHRTTEARRRLKVFRKNVYIIIAGAENRQIKLGQLANYSLSDVAENPWKEFPLFEKEPSLSIFLSPPKIF
jgi:hypothetical protein